MLQHKCLETLTIFVCVNECALIPSFLIPINCHLTATDYRVKLRMSADITAAYTHSIEPDDYP